MKINISSIYKIIKKIWTLPIFFKSTTALPPLTVYFDITKKCNLKCFYCFQKNNKIKHRDLSTEQIKKIIDKIPKTSIIVFSGGEPLTRNDFSEILVHATKTHKCALLTNGLLINKKIANLLITKKVINIGISLDGKEKTYNKIKGTNNYKKLINNIKLIQNLKKRNKTNWPYIDIKTNILPETLEEIPALYNVAEKLKANYFTVSQLKLNNFQFNHILKNNIQEMKTIKTEQISIPYHKTLKLYKKLWQQNKNKKTKLRLYPEITTEKQLDNYYANKPNKKCTQPWIIATINPAGDLSPCGLLKIGNLLENNDFLSLWNSNKMKKFRKTMLNNSLEICRGCCYAIIRK